MGMTAENSKIVRLTNWVETGSVQSRILKGIVLFFILCISFCVWQLIVIFILVCELYYLYYMSEYRIKRADSLHREHRELRASIDYQTKRGSTSRMAFRRMSKRRQSEIKIDFNKQFAASFSMLLRIAEMGTESFLQLIVQLYIAIYNDFQPGPLQVFSITTSYLSLVLGTFYWNSEFPWDRKYRDGLKAIPLYVLSIAYKCLSITTILGIMTYYSILPLGFLAVILAIVYYRLISYDPKNLFNMYTGSIYLRFISKITLG